MDIVAMANYDFGMLRNSTCLQWLMGFFDGKMEVVVL